MRSSPIDETALTITAETIEQDRGLWAPTAMRQKGQELVNASRWDMAEALARRYMALATKDATPDFYRVSDVRISQAPAPIIGNTTLHLGTNATETDGGIAFPHWPADPGLLNHRRLRIFAHDGNRGVVFVPSRLSATMADVIDLTHVWSINWFHFLLEVCGRLTDVHQSPNKARILINRDAFAGPYFDAIKMLAGRRIDRFAASAHWGRVTCGSVFQPSGCWRPSHYHMDPGRTDHRKCAIIDRDGAFSLYRRAWPSRKGRGRKLVIQRPEKAIRRCEDEPALVDAVVHKGFDPIAPETLPFAEQAAAFYDADVIVGVSGAAFANLVFCRPGTRVVCLRSSDSDSVTYSRLAEGFELDFTYIDCDPKTVGPSRDHSEFKADIESTLRALQ